MPIYWVLSIYPHSTSWRIASVYLSAPAAILRQHPAMLQYAHHRLIQFPNRTAL